ncbi:MAG: YraN family protein [Aquificaceae bacterium]
MRKGAEFEDRAVEYLRSLGYRIIKKNYHCREGEIDIIAQKDNTVIFVEVKGGKSKSFGDPVERIDYRKLRRIIRCMEEYLCKNPAEDYRLEVVLVRGRDIEHFPVSL